MPPDPTIDERIPPIQRLGDEPRIPIEFEEFATNQRIGSGGSATVYGAKIAEGPIDKIAVKKPDWNHTVTRADVETFVAEAERWARVDDHPHIATVFGSGSSPHPWLAIEYLNGGTLAERLPIEDPSEALWIGSTVADAVQHAHHRGVAHRDLTPANVLLDSTASGCWERPVVVDWGLATALDGTATASGFTPGYGAPEQVAADDSRSVGPLADIYQLGALLYALLTGRPPERNQNEGTIDGRQSVTPPSEVREPVPAAIDSIVLDALAKDPSDRVRTAAQFADACERCFYDLVEREQTADHSQDEGSNPSESIDSKHQESVVAQPDTVIIRDDTIAELDEYVGPEPGMTINKPTAETSDERAEDRDGRDGWFAPSDYPETSETSIAGSLRKIHASGNTERDRSLAGSLRRELMKTNGDLLAERLSMAHSQEEKR